MFAPTKTYRRWHRRVNVAQRRFAVASAIAASGVPSLVQAHGHVIDELAEVPLVVTDKIEGFAKTKEAVALLKRLKLWSDIERVSCFDSVHHITSQFQVYDSKRQRAGKGKRRNRRHKQKKGPVIVYNHDGGLVRAFRNIPGTFVLNCAVLFFFSGVTLQKVTQLNLLKLAPGGHLGRLIVWTDSAFRKLDSIFGTLTRSSDQKKNFVLPRPKMVNSDFKKIINSENVLNAIKLKAPPKPVAVVHRNPLRKPRLMKKLNPFSEVGLCVEYLNFHRLFQVLRRQHVLASSKPTIQTK